MNISGWSLLLALLLPAFAVQAEAPARTDPPILIAVIIDDIGTSLVQGKRAIQLPGAVTYSFLPHTTHAQDLAEAAYVRNKEIMLHLPMEAATDHEPGPGALTAAMTRKEMLATLDADLAAIPHVAGINNHMGSRLTRDEQRMTWLMEALSQRSDLFFIDSRTTLNTVAQRIAAEQGVRNLRRDIFLDNIAKTEDIAHQFSQLLELARQQGSAIAIGHPHPATLRFLEEQLPHLAEVGVQLVPASFLIHRQQHPEARYTPSSAPVTSPVKIAKVTLPPVRPARTYVSP